MTLITAYERENYTKPRLFYVPKKCNFQGSDSAENRNNEGKRCKAE